MLLLTPDRFMIISSNYYNFPIFPGIDSLFNKINCDKSPIVEMLGDSGVTDNNMMQVRTLPFYLKTLSFYLKTLSFYLKTLSTSSII